MARRKNDSLQKTAMWEMMQDYLKNNDISIKSGPMSTPLCAI